MYQTANGPSKRPSVTYQVRSVIVFIWASCRRPPRTSASAVGSCPIWSSVVCNTKPDCWSSSTVGAGGALPDGAQEVRKEAA